VPTAAPAAGRAAGQESWLQRQILTLPRLSAPGSRLSPHETGQGTGRNGRACQLLAPGSIRCSCSAKTYLILLYEQGRYAETACESDLAVEG